MALCACGCKSEVLPGRKYRRGHKAKHDAALGKLAEFRRKAEAEGPRTESPEDAEESALLGQLIDRGEKTETVLLCHRHATFVPIQAGRPAPPQGMHLALCLDCRREDEEARRERDRLPLSKTVPTRDDLAAYGVSSNQATLDALEQWEQRRRERLGPPPNSLAEDEALARMNEARLEAIARDRSRSKYGATEVLIARGDRVFVRTVGVRGSGRWEDV